jgi:hypothetical protein
MLCLQVQRHICHDKKKTLSSSISTKLQIVNSTKYKDLVDLTHADNMSSSTSQIQYIMI